jgi:putative FmdB family regulatory protein
VPTYEYECNHCKYTFEVFQKITEAPLKACPKCNKKVTRLIGGGSGIIFKGTGFYSTDYRKGGAPKEGSCAKNKEGCKSCPHSH